MKFIKALFLAIVGICLVVLGIGNMAPVDLYLVPERFTGDAFALKGIPLAAVIIAAVLLGLIIGQFLEWLREGKVRRTSNDRGREVMRLRREVEKLRHQVADPDDDLPKVPVR